MTKYCFYCQKRMKTGEGVLRFDQFKQNNGEDLCICSNCITTDIDEQKRLINRLPELIIIKLILLLLCAFEVYLLFKLICLYI